MDNFWTEYVAHVLDKRCPSGVCSALLEYLIDPKRCTGCTLCSKVCPVSCISGTKKEPHSIDPSHCIKCGACFEKCKFDAVTKR
jgi:NADP-reducing hydrogenase subunit HndC